MNVSGGLVPAEGPKRKRRARLNVAADRAGVSVGSIRRWQDEGALTDHRTNGGHRRVDLDELDALLDRRRREAFDRTAKQ